ncbi:MAG TPA: hypothetical protein VGN82_13450 [Bosea sp. (in: a-proteobacteria)]|jgi:hypothetical protein|uniref:bestrophin-like domain n=1 Tax=Bosea sp. (in: a-proteobacteria) TaxID=1871050 RepID=UPI002E1023A0|nr:hypothetical protein [Bosea sp. (in: a-proteobacteria)]
MEFATIIAERSILAFGLSLFLAHMVVYELGYRVGRRLSGGPANAPEAVGVVVGGMLALLAFVLALTLSFANARFGERRVGGLAEANAIGTAWLRAKAIGTPRGDEIALLLEQYTVVRIDFVRAGRDLAVNETLNQKTGALQSQIWGHLSAIVRERPDAISGALMASLNDTFDASTSERLAFETRLPAQLFWLLIGITLVTLACLGYQFGLRSKPLRILIALLTLMWTSIIVGILDLASGRIGKFQTGTAAYEWTLNGYKSGVTIPPLPASR